MRGVKSRTTALIAVPAIVTAGLIALSVIVMPGAGVGAPKDADVDRRNPDGSTPLQWAVHEGDVAEVRRLIDSGAEVSLANDYGATPMSLAAEVADTEILKLLLDTGADADSPNAEGQTALMAVARTGNVEAAQVLLEHGATVERTKLGRADGSHVGVRAPAS
jgi:hypothetical protein